MGLQFQRLYYKKDRIPEKYNELEAIKYVSRQRLKVLAAPNKLLHHTLIHVVLIVTGGWRGGYNNYLMICIGQPIVSSYLNTISLITAWYCLGQ